MSTSDNKFSPESKIYVAGHRGLVGSAIMRRLKQEGFSNILTATRQELDLRNQAAVNAWFEVNRPEYVFLVAGKVGGIWANSTYPAEFIYDNLMIHATVVHAAHLYNTTKLLYLGSSCIYPRDCSQPIKEEYLLTGPLEPTNEWYALAKIAGIKMCQAYRKQYGFNTISAMPTNLYGPNDHYDLKNSHVLPALIRKFHLAKLAVTGDLEAITDDETRHGPIPDDILQNLGIERAEGSGLGFIHAQPSALSPERTPGVMLWGTGAPRREFLYVDDLADASLFLMRHYDDEQIVNIGVGEDVSIKELAEMVGDAVGFNGNVIWDASKPDGTPRKLLDVSGISSLGWKAKTDLRQGIEQAYGWYLESS